MRRGVHTQFIPDFVSETGLFALCNFLFSYSYRLSDSACEEKMSRDGNACMLNVFIVECSSVPYIMVKNIYISIQNIIWNVNIQWALRRCSSTSWFVGTRRYRPFWAASLPQG